MWLSFFKYYPLLLCALLSFLPCNELRSATPEKDSLHHKLLAARLQEKPYLLNQLFWRNIYNNREQAKEYAQEGLFLSRAIQDQRAEHGLLLCMATYYHTADEHDKEIEFLFRSLSIARQVGEFEMALSELAIGESYTHYRQLPLASEYLQSAIKRVHAYDQIWFKAKAYHKIGKVYMLQGMLRKAEMHQLKALHLFNYLKNTISVSWVHETLADIYLQMDMHELARQHLQKAEHLFRLQANNHGLYNTRMLYGKLAYAEQDFNKAINDLEEAADYLAKLEYAPQEQAGIQLEKAKVFLASQQTEAALDAAYDAHTTLTQFPDTYTFLESIKLLAQIHQYKGNQAAAIAYLQKGVERVSRIDQRNKEIEFDNLSLISEVERQNQENEILTHKARLEKQENLQNILLVVMAFFMLLAWLLLWAYLNKRSYSSKLRKSHCAVERHKNALLAANQRLAQQNETLQQINAEKESTIRVVTHDLKAPLNRIAGLANILQLTLPKVTPEQQGYFQKINQIIEEGSHTIHHMLDARLLEDESIQLNKSTFSLDALILEVAEKYQHKAYLKKICIHIQGTPCTIHSDIYYLGRCLENLLSNAVKFSFPGEDILVRWSLEDDWVKIEVEDRGPGIKSSETNLLFKKYQRLTARPTGGESSVGLGLAIVKGIVEKLDGSVHFSHAREHGAIFTLKLPYRASPSGDGDITHQKKQEPYSSIQDFTSR
jgi:signal transduction histidine kinase